MNQIEQLLAFVQKNSTRLYLVLANVVLVLFAIVFANTGFLPFRSWGDFAFLLALGLLLAFYRPSWAFALFVGSLVIENINLAPQSLPLALRPYQFLAVLSLGAVLWQISRKQSVFTWPKLVWADWLVGMFVLAGFVSSFFAAQKGLAFKQAIVAFSFAIIYLLVRIYVQNGQDLKKVAPFFVGSSLVALGYGIWQNVRFLHGATSFEVMPGRPNATFTEADWLGTFLVFLLSVLYAVIYYFYQKRNKVGFWSTVINHQSTILVFVVLILTVARSAWLGASVVGVVFTTLFLVKKDWKGAWQNAAGIVVAVLLALGIVVGFKLTNFQLFNRAQSTGTGLQKITIACMNPDVAVPEKINSVEELANYRCRHINLEEIAQEKRIGSVVREVYRPDPNVGVRAGIYQKVFAQLKVHPLVGIGWGNIARVLGTDERGAGLNASNIFLETWLGAGSLGFLALTSLLGYILVKGLLVFFKGNDEIVSMFALLGLVAIVVPNLFNSGIFLGFVWAYLAAAVSLLNSKGLK